jgi:hypothetical protein
MDALLLPGAVFYATRRACAGGAPDMRFLHIEQRNYSFALRGPLFMLQRDNIVFY